MTASEDLQEQLNFLLKTVPGLEAITISDRDGVRITKATRDSAPELAMRPSFLASISMSMDQGCKVGIGKCKTIISQYGKHQVVNFNLNPFSVTLIASKEANTGLLLSLENSFNPIIDELNRILD